MVTKEFEQLCEKEFALKQDKAYRGFDRELANLREHYAHHGLLVSSSRAQAVMDAALLFRCSISQRKGPSSSSPGG